MKTFLIVFVLIVGAIAVGWYVAPKEAFVVQDTPEEDSTTITGEVMSATPIEDGTYELDGDTSTMSWSGTRPLIPGYRDDGTIRFSAGQAQVASGSIVSGTLMLETATIDTSSTGGGQGESMLTRHLKSDDWFAVEAYPNISFALTGAELLEDGSTMLSGTLTIKNETHPVSFVSTVRQDDDVITMTANDIELDRTQWGLTYQSGSFFGDLGEKLISDLFTISFTAHFRAEPPELIEG